MSYLDALWTVLRWKRNGWEVHPIITDDFTGWF